MEKEEKYILDKIGRRTPFTVPDSYFEALPSKLMEMLPEHDAEAAIVVPTRHRMFWQRYRRMGLAAASLLAAVFSLGIYMHNGEKPMAEVQASTPSEALGSSSYTEIDAMADYAMLDSEDLYAYMHDSE